MRFVWWLKTLFRKGDFFLSKREFVRDDLLSTIPYVRQHVASAKIDEVTFVASLLTLPGYTSHYHYTFRISEILKEMESLDSEREEYRPQSDAQILTHLVKGFVDLNTKDDVRRSVLRALAALTYESSNIPSIVTLFDDYKPERNAARGQIFWYYDNMSWAWKRRIAPTGFDQAKRRFTERYPAWGFTLEEVSLTTTLTAFIEPCGPLADLIPHLPADGIVVSDGSETSYQILFSKLADAIDVWLQTFGGMPAEPFDESDEDPLIDVISSVRIYV